MRVLVYGVGVLGSYLAHVLMQNGNEVTLLARGSRYDELAQNGLLIRHTVQMKTTKDKVNLVQALDAGDIYDIVFVVMQYTQLAAVLPTLTANQSKLFVLVGNNVTPDDMKAVICSNSTDKTVLFGFQTTGGRHENGKIISIHANAKMHIGTLNGEDYASEQNLLSKAFAHSGYKLNFRKDMKSYLLSHVAFIMPIAYACYATNGNLKKADKDLLHQIMDAAKDGLAVLKANQIPVPPEDEDYVYHKRKSYYRMLWVCAKTFIGRLAASDHAMNAVKEMTALSNAFDLLKRKASIPTPAWDGLEQYLHEMNRSQVDGSK